MKVPEGSNVISPVTINDNHKFVAATFSTQDNKGKVWWVQEIGLSY